MRERFETFLADLAVSFLKQPSGAIGLAVDRALADLTDVLEVDRSGVALFSPDLRELNTEYSFSRPGFPELPHEDLATLLPWYTRQLREGRRVKISAAAHDLPPEADEERRYLAKVGLRSHVGLPLVVDESPLGALCVASLTTEREWSDEFLSRLELLASAFAYALYRRRAEARISAAEDLNRSVLRSLSSELLVVDGEGRVVALNESKGRSARREAFPIAEGMDYLATLADQAGAGFTEAPRLVEGIRSVLSGRVPRFETTYAFALSAEPHHYLLQVSPLDSGTGLLVLHTDVSELERARAALQRGLHEAEERKERLEAENAVLQREVSRTQDLDAMVGTSAGLLRVLEEIDQVAPTEAPVLLLGETGTGKELAARAVHRRSRRHGRALVTVNCAALPPDLVESELFGHERGAFTGAHRRSAGRFEVADGGTLFLDEIGELSPEVQAKLLRVLQRGEFERLGSSRTLRTNVRLIAATNRDLASAMPEGRFRSDLYYRLSVFPVVLPPLRERREDIPVLVWHFVAQKQARLGKSVTRIPPRLMRAFTAHAWPGNVRELENVIERALILTEGPTLTADPVFLRSLRAVGRVAGAGL